MLRHSREQIARSIASSPDVCGVDNRRLALVLDQLRDMSLELNVRRAHHVCLHFSRLKIGGARLHTRKLTEAV